MIFYPFNIGDYRKDAGHLTALEHGIYRSLIDSYYVNEGPLSADDAFLMRTHCIRTKDEIRAFNQIVSEFFILDDGKYRHHGCDKVIDKILRKSDKARASAESRWQRDNANALRTDSECNANGMLPKDITERETNTTQKPAVPACPVEQIIQLYRDTAKRLPSVRIVPDSVKAHIRARWLQDRRFQSLEFWRGFFEYCESNKFLSGQSEARGDRKPFRASLAWVVNATNFAKIINEDYA